MKYAVCRLRVFATPDATMAKLDTYIDEANLDSPPIEGFRNAPIDEPISSTTKAINLGTDSISAALSDGNSGTVDKSATENMVNEQTDTDCPRDNGHSNIIDGQNTLASGTSGGTKNGENAERDALVSDINNDSSSLVAH